MDEKGAETSLAEKQTGATMPDSSSNEAVDPASDVKLESDVDTSSYEDPLEIEVQEHGTDKAEGKTIANVDPGEKVVHDNKLNVVEQEKSMLEVELEPEERIGIEDNVGSRADVDTTTQASREATCPECQKAKANGIGEKSRRESIESKITGPGGLRHVVALLALSSIVLANTNRQAFNQALSRMVRSKRETSLTTMASTINNTSTEYRGEFTTVESNYFGEETSITSETPGVIPTGSGQPSLADAGDESPPQDVGHEDLYDWRGEQVSALQGAFSYGYMPFMIPGGRLSEIYGAKWVVFLSGFGSALCSLMTPFLADYSFSLLVGSRVLMGICQTGVSPALYALLTRWLAPNESSVYLAMIKVGVMIGFMIGSLIHGFLSWRMTFYVVGAISLLWSVMWAVCVTSNPEEHKFIHEKELAYIHERLGHKGTAMSSKTKGEKKKTDSAPWLKIITNPVVLAFVYTKFTVKLSTDSQTMQLPMYLKNVLGISDKLNGPLNAVNFGIQAVFTGVVAWAAKEMIVRRSFGLGKTGVRRLFQGINNFGMGSGYLLISLSKGSVELACCAVMIISISSMFGSGGEAVFPVDVTTQYSASIMAIANSMANFSGIVLPPLVNLLLNNELTDSVRWNYVWYCIAGIVMSGGLAFSLFAKAKMQHFEMVEPEEPPTIKLDKLEMVKAEVKNTMTVIEMNSIERKV